MNKDYCSKSVVVVIAAFLCGLFSGSLCSPPLANAQRSGQTSVSALGKWEYSEARAQSHDQMIEKLNKLGDEGWELVNTMPYDSKAGNYVIYLKRHKR